VEAFSSRPDTPWGERKRYDTSIRRLSHPAGREAKESGRISLNESINRRRTRSRSWIDRSLFAGELPSREKRRSPRNVAVVRTNRRFFAVSFHSRCLWTMPDDAKALVALLTITTWAVSRDPRIIGEIMITEQTWSMMLDSDVTSINEWVVDSPSLDFFVSSRSVKFARSDREIFYLVNWIDFVFTRNFIWKSLI